MDSQLLFDDVIHKDFFDYQTSYKFDSIIGNPPYVRHQDIVKQTKNLLPINVFDNRSNLYLFFIYKSLLHLADGGELIFITPRDFCKLTSSIKLNQLLYQMGTITHYIECGDNKIFNNAQPNCVIWRFEKNNFSRKTNYALWQESGDQNWQEKNFIENNGQLLFLKNTYPVKFNDVFYVKVGAVSGADDIFTNEQHGNKNFVCSYTNDTGKTKPMIFNKKIPYLEKFKEILLNRKIKAFDNSNWWQWGRHHYISSSPRIYVNNKTRKENPFFLHDSKDYDGSILAIFPKKQNIPLDIIKELLNKVNWDDLGFYCDGRFIFNQKSLENVMLPNTFAKFVNGKSSLV